MFEMIQWTGVQCQKEFSFWIAYRKYEKGHGFPKMLEDAPSIQFIQGAGTCGLLSFSSAFYEYLTKQSQMSGWKTQMDI